MPVGTISVLVNLDIKIAPVLGSPKVFPLDLVPSINTTNFQASFAKTFLASLIVELPVLSLSTGIADKRLIKYPRKGLVKRTLY